MSALPCLALWFACSSGPTASALDPWLSRRGMDRAALLAERGGAAPSEDPGVAYVASTGLTLLRWADDPALYYYDGDSQVMIVLSNPDALAGLDPAGLAARFGTPDAELPSRAGKPFRHHVCAGSGVAWSSSSRELAFVELFAPTDLASWKQRFHEDPGAFIK